MPSLSDNLYQRCFEALCNCDEFASDGKLRAIFERGELATYQKWFLEHTFDTTDARVKNTITYLVRQRLQGVRPVFPLLLAALRDALFEGDALRDVLDGLLDEVQKELGRSATESGEIRGDFLRNSDRDWMIKTVNAVITFMSPEGIKNLLRGSLSDDLIDRINYKDGSLNIAESIVAMLAQQDKLNSPYYHDLYTFLTNLVELDTIRYTETEKKIREWLLNYDQFKSTAQNMQQSVMMRLNHSLAHTQSGKAPGPSKHKIDLNTLIRYNLDVQQIRFIDSFNERYKGALVFAVACIDRVILEEYIIGRMIWELNQRTGRRAEVVSDIYLINECTDFSSIERTTCSIQQQIEARFAGESIAYLLSKNRETDLVIVVWHDQIPSNRLKEAALLFWRKLEEQISDVLRSQGRCLILFWATFGTPPVNPLDPVIALPTFQKFEIDNLKDWLEIKVKPQLRKRHVPEPDINAYLDKLIAKITTIKGNLPWAYTYLKQPLER